MIHRDSASKLDHTVKRRLSNTHIPHTYPYLSYTVYTPRRFCAGGFNCSDTSHTHTHTQRRAFISVSRDDNEHTIPTEYVSEDFDGAVHHRQCGKSQHISNTHVHCFLGGLACARLCKQINGPFAGRCPRHSIPEIECRELIHSLTARKGVL